MNRGQGFAGALVLTITTIVGPASLVAAQDALPDLVGVWTGRVEAGISLGTQGHEPVVSTPTFGNYEITFTLDVAEQDGRAMVGTWSSPSYGERIFGVLRRDNVTLILVDEDSYFDGRLLSPTTMELCLAETHVAAIGAWCLYMEKQASK